MKKRNIYLTRQHFLFMLCAALAVHIIMGAAYMLSPSLKVNKVPVHVLNIKLGSGDAMAMTDSYEAVESEKTISRASASQPVPVPPPHENARVKSAEPKAVKAKDAPAKAPAQEQNAATPAAAKQGETNAIKAYAPTGSAAQAPLSSNAEPAQYIRRQGDARGQGDGSPIGNSLDSQAVMMQRYTQLISTWINRQKALMNRALQPGMRGNIVVRLRIDRRGKIHMFKLDKATGVPSVDAAAADMVRAADPVPPVPSTYPGGNMFEFLIPINYSSQQ